MRTFKVVDKSGCLHNEYISEDVEYTLNQITDTVYFCRNTKEVSCSYMNTSTFKAALRAGDIVFTD